MNRPSMPTDVTCPFCGESGFDLIGLKNHFDRGWCEVFENTETVAEERERKKNETP